MPAKEPLSENPSPLSRAVKHPLSESIFSTLSAEIHLEILEHLPKDSLAKVASTCTYFHSITVPLIYHTIDLSIHNSGQQIGQIDDRHRGVIGSRQLFFKQIICKPEYAHYVKSLTWTIHLEDSDTTGPTTKLEETQLEEIFRMFAMLKEVTHVDLHIHSWYRWYYPRILSLFPKAKQIVLNGEIPRHLCLSILHGKWHAGYLRLSIIDSLNIKSPSTSVSGLGREDDVQFAMKQFERTWPSAVAHFFGEPLSNRPYFSHMSKLFANKRFVRLCMVKQAHGTSPAIDSPSKSNDAHFKCTLFMDLSDPPRRRH
jgi:hypothetical protein